VGCVVVLFHEQTELKWRRVTETRNLSSQPCQTLKSHIFIYFINITLKFTVNILNIYQSWIKERICDLEDVKYCV
jgi:hypothetical protein